MLTVQDLKAALPKNLQSNATQEYADKVNLIASDPEFAREVRDNFMTYSKVLTEGKYKTEDYINAVTYCTFKLMGFSNKDSYIRTFPDRYQNLRARGATDKDISAYVAGYHKNQLVNRILEQAHIPMWLVNQDVYQKAINIQLDIAQNANSEMARTNAANSLLVALKQPEKQKIELDVGLKGGGGLGELREAMADIAEKQRELIAGGAGARLVGRIPIGQQEEAEIVDVTPTPPPVSISAAVKAANPQSLAALNDAMQHGTGMVKVTLEDKEIKTEHVSFEELHQEPVASPRPSLFGDQPKTSDPMPAPKAPEDIKKPAANYAECCDRAIEDCVCIETNHIYLPVKSDVPQPRRMSLFDDPADMP